MFCGIDVPGIPFWERAIARQVSTMDGQKARYSKDGWMVGWMDGSTDHNTIARNMEL
jgi:hypothetical protein